MSGVKQEAGSSPPQDQDTTRAMPNDGRLPLTVLIPTLNEARNLRDCLASVSWADEILVVDSLSTDDTVAIATAAGARVIVQACVNIEAQKNWALPQCTHPWVLIVDADERLTPELAAEIRELLARGSPPHAAYAIRRRTFVFGRELHYSGMQGDRVTRLFDRQRARYPDREVHADLQVEGTTGRLRYPMLHLTSRTLDDYLDRMRRYSTWAANDWWKRGRRVSALPIIVHPCSRFFSTYVWKRGFLDGLPGLLYAALSAASVLMRWAKLWAMHDASARQARWPDGTLIIHRDAIVARADGDGNGSAPQ